MRPAALPALLLTAATCVAADPAITIYNDGFAVVRETFPLELRTGINTVTFADATAELDDESVILRDIAGRAEFRILEQSYRSDTLWLYRMLERSEGQVIEFIRQEPNKPDRVVRGKVIRAGLDGSGNSPGFTPIIEVDGKVQFSLPGEPRFPSLGEDFILNPTLTWKIDAPEPAKFNAEVAYISGGFSWQARYNLIAAEKSDAVDLVGWVTMSNESGKDFPETRIKLMAGDVRNVGRSRNRGSFGGGSGGGVGMAAAARSEPPVTEKTFDEYHLYNLAHPTTLRNEETKQVEFVRAAGIQTRRVYVLEGPLGSNDSPTEKVKVFREFRNSEANKLGVALPKGNVRFYTQDADRQLECVGGNSIEHTAKDELIRILVGNSFDLVGEHRLKEETRDEANHTATQTIEVKVRNRKTEAATIIVRERAARAGWTLTAQSQPHEKKDASTFEFTVPLQPGEEKVVTYTIRYNW